MHPDVGAKHQYVIKAFRQLGSETELRSLMVVGAEISPVFSQRHREYAVRLDLTYDVVRVVYGLADNEQRISSSAQEERPATGADTGDSSDGSRRLLAAPIGAPFVENRTTVSMLGILGAGALGAGALGAGWDALGAVDAGVGRQLFETGLVAASPRRLAAVGSGEVQFREAHVDFLLDVGFMRTIELTVQCADPTQASIGTYKLHVSRPGCIPERPYFDPQKKACVNFCSSGFYRNRDTHRCSRCNDNCKICTGLLGCQMCTPDRCIPHVVRSLRSHRLDALRHTDSADYSYALQPDGKCRAVENHLFRRYRWWCAGLGVLLLFLVLIGCCGIVQLCCSAGSANSGRFSRLNDTDDDDDDAPKYGGGSRFARY